MGDFFDENSDFENEINGGPARVAATISQVVVNNDLNGHLHHEEVVLNQEDHLRCKADTIINNIAAYSENGETEEAKVAEDKTIASNGAAAGVTGNTEADGMRGTTVAPPKKLQRIEMYEERKTAISIIFNIMET